VTAAASSDPHKACTTGDVVDANYHSKPSGATIHSFNSDGTVTVDWDDLYVSSNGNALPWADVFHKGTKDKCYREDEGQMVNCAVGDQVFARHQKDKSYTATIQSIDADGQLVVKWQDDGTTQTVEPSHATKLGGVCRSTKGVSCSVGDKVSALYLDGRRGNWWNHKPYEATIHDIKFDHGRDAMGSWDKSTITLDWSDNGQKHREVASYQVSKDGKQCVSAEVPPCEARCASEGYCSSGSSDSGTTSSAQHPSCVMGCKMAKEFYEMANEWEELGRVTEDCQAKCRSNDNTCGPFDIAGEEAFNCADNPAGCHEHPTIKDCYDGCTWGSSHASGQTLV